MFPSIEEPPPVSTRDILGVAPVSSNDKVPVVVGYEFKLLPILTPKVKSVVISAAERTVNPPVAESKLVPVIVAV